MEYTYYISEILGDELVIRGIDDESGRWFEYFDVDERDWINDPELLSAVDRGGLPGLRGVTQDEAFAVIEHEMPVPA